MFLRIQHVSKSHPLHNAHTPPPAGKQRTAALYNVSPRVVRASHDRKIISPDGKNVKKLISSFNKCYRDSLYKYILAELRSTEQKYIIAHYNLLSFIQKSVHCYQYLRCYLPLFEGTSRYSQFQQHIQDMTEQGPIWLKTQMLAKGLTRYKEGLNVIR